MQKRYHSPPSPPSPPLFTARAAALGTNFGLLLLTHRPLPTCWASAQRVERGNQSNRSMPETRTQHNCARSKQGGEGDGNGCEGLRIPSVKTFPKVSGPTLSDFGCCRSGDMSRHCFADCHAISIRNGYGFLHICRNYFETQFSYKVLFKTQTLYGIFQFTYFQRSMR